MKPTRSGSARVVGMMVVALLLAAALAPPASAQEAYAAVAGKWAGLVVGPSGSSYDTVWRINPDGTFSMEADIYTAVGSLTARGPDYSFTYERDGQTFTGTLASQQANGKSALIGRGEGPNGPLDITLIR